MFPDRALATRGFAFSFALACGVMQFDPRAGDSAPAGERAAGTVTGQAAGQLRDDNGLNMALLWCPAGEFTTEGNKASVKGDRVSVVLTRGFWLGKYEVTQAEWKQVMTTEPWTDPANLELVQVDGDEAPQVGEKFPVTFVNWDDAQAFCRKLSERERAAGRLPAGWEYTLPTDAQWEYACRAGTDGRFSFGGDGSRLADYAWFAATREDYAHPVGLKKPNPWGFRDLHGNVAEWCRDWYDETTRGGRDPEGTRRNQYRCRVTRGGSWSDGAQFCESAFRSGGPDETRATTIGFRVALTPEKN
jgi:formylglycine-generating enzyme required for sulfatase activity